MAKTLHDIINDKFRRLDDVANTFESRVARSERRIYQDVLALLSQLTLDRDGRFKPTRKNLRIAGKIGEQLRTVLDNSTYIVAVEKFAAEFSGQIRVNDAYFRRVVPNFKGGSSFAVDVPKVVRNNTVNALINTSPDIEYIGPMAEAVEQAVINNSSYTETIKYVKRLTTGNKRVDGKLLRYAKQIAHDSFAVADRGYTQAVADEYDIDWFFYSGSPISTTRDWCRTRSNRYYHRSEIESWGNSSWDGQTAGTNSQTIFTYAGGYNCRHSFMPLSVFAVPQSDIDRAIRNRWYKPTRREKEMLKQRNTNGIQPSELIPDE